jgi:hypothetical protein
MAARMLPETVVRAPELAVKLVGVALALTVELLLDVEVTERVVSAGTAAVVVSAMTVAGAVPSTRAAEAVETPETVTKVTCGMVMAVEMTVTAELDGMMDPEAVPVVSVTAYVMVV